MTHYLVCIGKESEDSLIPYCRDLDLDQDYYDDEKIIGSIKFTEPNYRDMTIEATTASRYFWIMEFMTYDTDLWFPRMQIPISIGDIYNDDEQEIKGFEKFLSRYVTDQVLNSLPYSICKQIENPLTTKEWNDICSKVNQSRRPFILKQRAWAILHAQRELGKTSDCDILIDQFDGSIYDLTEAATKIVKEDNERNEQ